MTEKESHGKIIFSKPVNVDGWWNWEIVIDGLPVAYFGEPQNKTVRLSEGQHEIQLRSPWHFGVFATTQKVRIVLKEDDELTVKVGPDPKFMLILLFLISISIMQFPDDRRYIAEIVDYVCYAACGALLLAMFMGFIFRLTVSPKDPQTNGEFKSRTLQLQKQSGKSSSVDPLVKRMSEDFATYSKEKKLSKPKNQSNRFSSNLAFYLLLFGLFTIEKNPPMDGNAVAALVVGFTITLLTGTWAKETILKQAGICFLLLSSLIGLAVTLSPPLGSAAQQVFLSISLCGALGFSLYFGWYISESMQKSRTSGVFAILALLLLVTICVPMIITSLLTFIVHHT